LVVLRLPEYAPLVYYSPQVKLQLANNASKIRETQTEHRLYRSMIEILYYASCLQVTKSNKLDTNVHETGADCAICTTQGTAPHHFT
jgi:hypothetical protein